MEDLAKNVGGATNSKEYIIMDLMPVHQLSHIDSGFKLPKPKHLKYLSLNVGAPFTYEEVSLFFASQNSQGDNESKLVDFRQPEWSKDFMNTPDESCSQKTTQLKNIVSKASRIQIPFFRPDNTWELLTLVPSSRTLFY